MTPGCLYSLIPQPHKTHCPIPGAPRLLVAAPLPHIQPISRAQSFHFLHTSPLYLDLPQSLFSILMPPLLSLKALLPQWPQEGLKS